MAGITARIYTERVRREAALRGITLQNADIWSSQDSALQKLATDVWEAPTRRAYAQTEVAAATLTAGVVSLASYTDALHETIRNVVHSDTIPVCLAPYGASRRWLSYERNLFSYYGVVEAAALYIAIGDGAASAPADGTVSFVYNGVPTLANIHTNLIDDLIELHIGFAQAAAVARMAA
jgi:hypothetical protein